MELKTKNKLPSIFVNREPVYNVSKLGDYFETRDSCFQIPFLIDNQLFEKTRYIDVVFNVSLYLTFNVISMASNTPFIRSVVYSRKKWDDNEAFVFLNRIGIVRSDYKLGSNELGYGFYMMSQQLTQSDYHKYLHISLKPRINRYALSLYTDTKYVEGSHLKLLKTYNKLSVINKIKHPDRWKKRNVGLSKT